MPALRFLGGLFLLIGAIVLIADITNARGGVGNGFAVPLAKHWASLAPASLAASQKSIQAISGLLWDPIMKSVLAIPAWTWFTAIGALLAWTGRRRRRVNIFVN
ncbi:MAG: hypothetical protein ABL904_03270 [Hyphomicrobiaceae bacterium]